MVTLSLLGALFLLFYLLGRSADVVIDHVHRIGRHHGIPVALLGILLGLFTSLPELAIGIDASMTHLPEVALGDLFGGIIVVFGLILGIGIILNRTIRTDGHLLPMTSVMLYVVAPFVLGLNGVISRSEGIILLLSYVILVGLLIRKTKKDPSVRIQAPTSFWWVPSVISATLGLLVVIGSAHLIIGLTTTLLSQFAVSSFFIGLIVFSIGTNLPELIVTIRSSKRHIRELSVNTLIGSVLANIVVIAIMAILRPIPIVIDGAYIITALFVTIISGCVLLFSYTKSEFDRWEGGILVVFYILFLFHQIGFVLMQ